MSNFKHNLEVAGATAALATIAGGAAVFGVHEGLTSGGDVHTAHVTRCVGALLDAELATPGTDSAGAQLKANEINTACGAQYVHTFKINGNSAQAGQLSTSRAYPTTAKEINDFKTEKLKQAQSWDKRDRTIEDWTSFIVGAFVVSGTTAGIGRWRNRSKKPGAKRGLLGSRDPELSKV